MNKLTRLIQLYLIIGLPFVIACMVWSNAGSEEEILQHLGLFKKIAWELLSWNLMLWFAVLIIFLIILVAVPSVRDNTLRHLANLKERDEREEYITGKAARSAYLSTLSLSIFFLFFSVFSLNVFILPKDQLHKKRVTVAIHVGVDLLEKSKSEIIPQGKILFSTQNIMPSSSSILIILLVWQLLIFNYVARKEQKIES